MNKRIICRMIGHRWLGYRDERRPSILACGLAGTIVQRCRRCGMERSGPFDPMHGYWPGSPYDPERTTNPEMTPKQKRLAKEHGTPAKFARDVYAAVPTVISMDEARDAIERYNTEWSKAASGS